jgi:hypothetical protein
MVAAPVLTGAKMAQPEDAATGAVETLIRNCFPRHRDEFHWVGIWDTAAPIQSLTNHPYIGGLRAFGALRDFEFHLVSLFQGFKPLSLNGRVMDEYVLRAFHFNKPKSLLIIEPLDSTFRHYNLP